MKVSIRIDEDLHSAAKAEAAASGQTFSAFVAAALREHLRRRDANEGRRRVVLPTFTENGVQPGVNINDSAELLDYMDAHDPKFHELYPQNRLRESLGIPVDFVPPDRDSDSN